jgi:hypothetical protein
LGSMVEVNPDSDRYFDLSLRLLTIFVLVSLFCCVGFLAIRWIGPHWHRTPDESHETRETVVAPPAPTAVAAPAPVKEVLMDPHKTFRCIEQGRVSFSDRACNSGSEQILPLNSAPSAPAGATAPAVSSTGAAAPR